MSVAMCTNIYIYIFVIYIYIHIYLSIHLFVYLCVTVYGYSLLQHLIIINNDDDYCSVFLIIYT